ncbi:MAG TPA: cytochrome c [Nitrospirota bacterium]|nr:cytochrome c [Nitrospirota bacterium]
MKNLLMIVMIAILAAGPVIVRGQGQADPGKDTVHSIELPVLTVQLKAGPGFDKVSTLCNICHSTDYITIQPPLPRATWTTEVNKMIKVMGAPINEDDAKTIIDYLVTNYGNGN